MANNIKYFEWNKGPAIIKPSKPGHVKGLFLSSRTNKWTPANVMQVGDFFDNGDMISKDDFEKRFGFIGQDLPNAI
jgi:hypothetical protein|tara:strand:+ start:381 stop:608 length:228 start_codon:yes stop_codon:yes gene_type:complete